MSEAHSSPVSGSCPGCGCRLGFASSRDENGAWVCCGACAGSDRCTCGCRSERTLETTTDLFVPTRRMFAARHPDHLKVQPDRSDKARAFPFADRRRGR